MNTRDKFRDKLLKKPIPKDIKFSELESFLVAIGFNKRNKGKTSGSRIAFFHEVEKTIIQLHKSHASEPIKPKALNYVVETLQNDGHL